MNPPPLSSSPGRLTRARVLVILASMVAYALAFVGLYPVVEGTVALLAVLPAVAAGWLLGLRVGVLVGLLMSLLTVLLFVLADAVQILRALLLFIVSTGVAALVGWVRELLDRVEQQARELQVQRRREALYQTEKLAAMGSLVAGVAHELNNPLTVVVGHAHLLLEAAGPLREDLEKIVRAAERCARIVKNFLALARQYPLERQKVSLNQLVQEALELVAYPLHVDGVQVTVDLPRDLPILWGDPHQLHQVVVNLLTNAHQALREVPPPRRLTLTTRYDAGHGRVSLEVADTGPGVRPEIQGRIFEPFFTTRPPGQGTGLGLAICHGIIEEHGGTIRVESALGQGAVFRVELPVGAPPAGEPEFGVPEAQPPVQGKMVLVVDDELEIAALLATMLAQDAHQVDTAANGVVALDKLGKRAYDLILSDVRMPELDGPGLYREVERRHPELHRRFIFLTGDTLGPETRAFLEQTGAPSLSKPFVLEEVRGVIQRVLGPQGAPSAAQDAS